jgi:DNA invertase Pin-like site-specific DNA recombinase
MSDERQEHSIQDQRTELLLYAVKHGYKVLREYADPAISGDDTLRRVEFLRMREDAGKGEFAIVLCWDQDRFGRFDPIEGGYWILPFRNAGVRLETIAQGKIDWTDFSGRLRYVVEQEGKHAYLRDLSRNVCRGMARAAKAGEIVVACYGYRSAGGELVVEQDEAKVVKMIFRLYLSAKGSLRSVASRLNQDKVTSPAGKAWSVNSVRHVLTRRKYTGAYSWGSSVVGRYHGIGGGEIVLRQKSDKVEKATPISSDRRHPEIVTQDQFDRVQRLLQRRTTETSPSDRTYLLSGLLHCANCGSSMVGGRWGRSTVPVYGCSGYAQKGKGFCSHNRIVEAPLVEAIIRLIEKRYLSDTALNRLRQTIRKQATQTQPDRDLDAGTIRQRIKTLDKQIITGTERVFDAPKNLVGTIYSRLDQYKTERDRLQAQLEATATPSRASRLDVEETVEAAIAALRDLRKAIRGSDPENARELFRQIIGSIELSFDRQQVSKYTKSTFREGTIHVRPENVPTCSTGPTVPLW